MTTEAAAPEGAAVAERTWLDRLVAVVPLLSVFVWLCLVYAWEARGHVTPWNYTDELELTQLSRSIADTGDAARRGDPHFFQTLYAYVLAPAWLLGDTSTAYAIAKYVGIFVMTSVAFPVYFLARLLVSARPALFAAAASAAIPSLAYSMMVLEEPLAYPYAALCFLLITKALAGRTRGWIAAAALASIVAPLVRQQLALVPAVFVLAALLLVGTSGRARRWRRSWSAWDWAGAVVLATGALVVFSAVAGELSSEWLITTGHFRGRMIEYGLWAAGSLTIGVGVLPAVAGLAALFRPRGEQRSPELEAFTAVAVSALACFGVYTAVKAAYLSTVFATRVEERNLIYVGPLLFVATALWLERPRLRLAPLAASVGLAAYLIASTPYELDVRLAVDSFGLAILQMANRELAFTPGHAQWTLAVVLALSVLLLLAPAALGRGRRRREAAAVLVLAAGLTLAWNLAGEISAGRASNAFSKSVLGNFPEPPNWLDRATGGRPTLYLGQKIQDATGIHLIEFWNRSLKRVWSLDGSAPGPGPILTPDLADAEGTLAPDPGLPYVVAEQGVDVVGRVVARRARWTVYRVEPPLRLAHGQTGVFSDGWIGCATEPCPAAESGYSQFATPGGRAGFATVTVSRAGWRGPDKPGNVVIRVGTLVKGADKQPALGRVTAVRSWVVHSGRARTFVIPTPHPPIRIEVSVAPTFSPADYGASDRRRLGAQVGYTFSLTRPSGKPRTRS